LTLSSHSDVSNVLDITFEYVPLLVWTREVRRDRWAALTAHGCLVTFDVVLLRYETAMTRPNEAQHCVLCNRRRCVRSSIASCYTHGPLLEYE
jgi:hypothetical protein